MIAAAISVPARAEKAKESIKEAENDLKK